MEIKISQPKTKSDFEKYYDLRWRILRKPWKQPRGSEKDNFENQSVHIAAFVGDKIIGIGRLHLNSKKESQVRYMAVEHGFQGKGIGGLVLKQLEKAAKKKGAKYIILNSRETAVKFYKKYGYKIVGKADTMFGVIPHWKMKKDI